MSKKTLPYSEGDWFVIPLSTGDYSLGLIARANQNGILLGYFFGEQYPEVPDLSVTTKLRPFDAILIRRFGHLGLVHGEWPILGRVNTWHREDWPTPPFGKTTQDRKHAWRVEYSDDDIGKAIREVPISIEVASGLPEDGLSGHAAIKTRLAKLLDR